MTLTTPLPNLLGNTANPLRGQTQCTVKGSHTNSVSPHVNFAYASYRGAALHSYSLLGQTVTLWYNDEDLRIVDVYDKDGQELGPIYAPKPWLRYPFSMKTRQYIHKLTRDRRLHIRISDDPFEAYFNYVNRQSGKDNAREIARICIEFELDTLERDKSEVIIPENIVTAKNWKPFNSRNY
jgi:hypothetical protein